MELSKKVGYIKGLMAGLKINDSTPEGQVLLAMSDLLEEMAEEIEINADIIDNITAYIDEVEDSCDCLDDIEAEEIDPNGFFEDLDDFDGCCCDDCCSDEDDADDLDELEELDALSESLEEEAAEEQETDGEPDEYDFEEELPEIGADDSESEIVYECVCPICNFNFNVSQEDIDAGGGRCPGCGGYLEFA